MQSIRINRYLAMCGLGSRRTCEQLVAEGRVTLNGNTVGSLGERVRASDRVLVDGETAKPGREVVVLLHKPRGVVCTRSDPQGRETVYDLLPAELQMLAHVGRLDRESEGMLILTNAGDLAHRLTHPSSKVEKEYFVQIDRTFDIRDRQRLLDGIALEEGMAYAVAVEQTAPRVIRMVLQQGIKRQIRLMLDSLGYEVRQLVRTRIGSLVDTKLKAGKWRRLNPVELELLQSNPEGKGKGGKVAKSAKSAKSANAGKKPAASKAAAGILPPPPPTPKGRRPAVKAAAGSRLRSPDAPVRGTASAKLGESRRPAGKKSAASRGKPSFSKSSGKSYSAGGPSARRPAAKGKSAGSRGGFSASRSPARKSTTRKPAARRGAKRPG